MNKKSNEVLYYSKNIKEIIHDLENVDNLLPRLGVKEDTLAKLKLIKIKIKSLIEIHNRKLK